MGQQTQSSRNVSGQLEQSVQAIEHTLDNMGISPTSAEQHVRAVKGSAALSFIKQLHDKDIFPLHLTRPTAIVQSCGWHTTT